MVSHRPKRRRTEDVGRTLGRSPPMEKPATFDLDTSKTILDTLESGRTQFKLGNTSIEVEDFVYDHIFVRNAFNPVIRASDRRAFQRDVYDYARAKGLSSREAEKAVHAAEKIFREQRRLQRLSRWMSQAREAGRSMQEEWSRIKSEEGWNSEDLEGDAVHSEGSASGFESEIDDSEIFGRKVDISKSLGLFQRDYSNISLGNLRSQATVSHTAERPQQAMEVNGVTAGLNRSARRRKLRKAKKETHEDEQTIGNMNEDSKNSELDLPQLDGAVNSVIGSHHVPHHAPKSTPLEASTPETNGVVTHEGQNVQDLSERSELLPADAKTADSPTGKTSYEYSIAPADLELNKGDSTKKLINPNNDVGNESTLATPESERKTTANSPYFKTARPRLESQSSSKAVSCIPFPPLAEPVFGLIQERLAHDPFKLLVAVTFLNRTRGVHAIPVFYQMMDRYPTPKDLASADQNELADLIRHLGLQNTRAKRYVHLAQAWQEDPPIKGRRHRKLNYPNMGDGKDMKPNEVVDDDDDRSGAWEVAHLPTAGPYAIDSWRIFCRDVLRGQSTDWKGTGREDDPAFEPEWKRVVPNDKELKAYLRWMWLKEGMDWDPETGEKAPASQDLLAQANEGSIIWEEEKAIKDGDQPSALEQPEALIDSAPVTEDIVTHNV